jgi:hypothetical protein
VESLDLENSHLKEKVQLLEEESIQEKKRGNQLETNESKLLNTLDQKQQEIETQSKSISSLKLSLLKSRVQTQQLLEKESHLGKEVSQISKKYNFLRKKSISRSLIQKTLLIHSQRRRDSNSMLPMLLAILGNDNDNDQGLELTEFLLKNEELTKKVETLRNGNEGLRRRIQELEEKQQVLWRRCQQLLESKEAFMDSIQYW